MIVSRRWHRRFLYVYCPPYRWWKNSSLYRRWVFWRWKRSMRKLERVVGRKFIPAMKQATAAIVEWNDAYSKAES